MKRRWIPIKKIKIFDEMHYETENGWEVDEARDGKSTEEHVEGIGHIKEILKKGMKILPVLVAEDGSGGYTRLDGFKRCMAHSELKYDVIEAFVCTQEEMVEQRLYDFQDSKMRCWKGGQPKEDFKLYEGDEGEKEYEDTKFLFKSPNGDGLRIEVAETIHVHWGTCGKYRLTLGREDFIKLAEAVKSIK